jgi:hypothetical protein
MNMHTNLNMNLNQKLRNRNLDRRHKLRKVPDKFAFLQIERDDGGSVLDVSEGGLRFETFAPVVQDGPVHCWFSLNLRERIEVWGEVVWTDEERRYGGLRFLQLSEKGREQIREWISRPAPRPAPDKEYPRRGWEMDRRTRIGVNESDAVARFVSKARPRQGAASRGHAIPSAWEAPAAIPPARAPLMTFSDAGQAGDGATLFPAPKEVTAAGVELVPLQRYLSAKRRQLILGLLLGTFVSATVVVAANKYLNYSHENRGAGKPPAELSVQKSGGEAVPSAQPKPAVTNSASADIFSSGSQKRVVAGNHTPLSGAGSASADIFGTGNQKIHLAEVRTPAVAATETGGHPNAVPWKAAASNPPTRAPLQPDLSSKASRQKPAMSPKQLWAAIQAGNTKAAVELADLYIKGQGVAQNCNQARVLLLVASEKRNAEAIKRLAELDNAACPPN